MNNTEGMWGEPIAELKVGGINGISFRKGQLFGKRKPLVDNEIFVTEIRRELDDLDEEVFLIFAKKDNEGDTRLLKVSKGEPVYVTFDVFSD
jgi:hypothetical protein